MMNDRTTHTHNTKVAVEESRMDWDNMTFPHHIRAREEREGRDREARIGSLLVRKLERHARGFV